MRRNHEFSTCILIISTKKNKDIDASIDIQKHSSESKSNV